MKTGAALDLTFARDLLSATGPSGHPIHFTRQERALLLRLTGNPGRLLKRDALIAAIANGSDEPANDRHVDFLISQLRRKLGDNARTPRFIKTQYGEGYVWIGDVQKAEDTVHPLLQLGPIYGAHLTGASELVGALADTLGDQLGQDRIVAAGAGGHPGARPLFGLEFSIYDDRRGLQAAIVLRDTRTSAAVDSFRLTRSATLRTSALTDLAARVVQRMWSASALHDPAAPLSPREAPPWVRLFEAGLMLSRDVVTWRGNVPQIDAMLANNPGDIGMEVMRGLNLYTWLLQSLSDPSGHLISAEQWRSIEDEIEVIALSALPHVDGQPMMQLAVAKLLLFINRGYAHLARRISEDILSNSNAHAAAFALAGEAIGSSGEIERGVALLERGIELSEAGSYFQLYLLVTEAKLLMAGNNQRALHQLAQLTRNIAPAPYQTLQVFCALPGYEETTLFRHSVARDFERAKDALRFQYNISARRFALRRHRRNVIRPLASALVKHFDLGVISDEIELATGIRTDLIKRGMG